MLNELGMNWKNTWTKSTFVLFDFLVNFRRPRIQVRLAFLRHALSTEAFPLKCRSAFGIGRTSVTRIGKLQKCRNFPKEVWFTNICCYIYHETCRQMYVRVKKTNPTESKMIDEKIWRWRIIAYVSRVTSEFLQSQSGVSLPLFFPTDFCPTGSQVTEKQGEIKEKL